MSALPQTTTLPVNETPSTSETAVSSSSTDNAGAGPEGATQGNVDGLSNAPSDSQRASEGETQVADMGKTGQSFGGGETGSAEAAAEKLYEERIEDEYAKREGGA